MHIGFLNPQGNFDPGDSYWTQHPDFGGQLVYVKQLSLAMGELGHKVDILTRRIIDPEWPEFSERFNAYPGAPNVRIVRLPAGPGEFLRKERLWPYLVGDWVPNVIEFYENEGKLPDAFTTHYGDGGLCGVLIEDRTGVPFTFTAHSLGAQKMDKLHASRENLAELDEQFRFARRLVAERLSMNRSLVNITSTSQERYSQYTHNAYRGAVDPTADSRFAVVPPGVAMGIFDRDARHEEEGAVRQRIKAMLERDLAPDRLDLSCIVASSRLDPKKNHLGLVEAFACSPELRQRANLVMVTGNLDNPLEEYPEAGETEREVLDSLMDVIERENLRGQVSMFALRGQRELAAGYRLFSELHSVFALTAHYEPFGLAPLEAIAAGLPAVVTKFGGPSESLREGDEEYGLLVDPTDAEEVSAALYSLVVSEEQWQHFAAAGYRRVQERYTWQRTAEGYLRALGEDGTARGSPVTSRLTIHPYFIDPRLENDITLEALDDLYMKFEVLAVGETLVDFISEEQVNSLRAAKQFTRYLGGQPANVAVYVAKLGMRSTVLSMIGEDRFGEFVEEELQFHGVNTEALLKTEEMPTTNVFLTQTTGIPDFQVNRGADTLLDIRDVSEELIGRAKVVHTSCFALAREPARSAIRRALRLAHKDGKLVSLDPNYSVRIWPDKMEAWEVLAQILPYVTVVKPSLEDARRLFDYNMEEDELEEACLSQFHDLGAEVVIVTRSGGLVTVSHNAEVERVGPLSLVGVKSVIGGSDAFWGALLVAHLDGQQWSSCVRFAHEIAARKLLKVGHIECMIDRNAVYEQLAG
ncbi:MAG: PfkB family carbohydrate kinase [Anaerolineae bacterium]|jgi:sucrose-phosphate synthase